MNNVSFKSTFRPVTHQKFAKLSTAIGEKCFVNSPWTIKESVIAPSAVTKGVYDCSVLGITDGMKVFLLHLCPTKPENENFETIKNFIIKNIDSKKQYLSAALLGSQYFDTRSSKLFDKLKILMDELKIPCSTFRQCKEYFDVLYNSTKDEWCISIFENENNLNAEEVSSEEFFNKTFYKIELSSEDEFA